MKKFLFIFFAFVSSGFFAQVKEPLSIPPDAKIGLSLAGGGAKGFAHVGVLKVMDSLGVKVDYISGTSMGSIVGGLYASGYSAKEIEKVVRDTDFFDLILNEKEWGKNTFYNKGNDKYLLTVPYKNGKFNAVPKAVAKGQKMGNKLRELLHHVSETEDFSRLPIPFLCVATNAETGKMRVFESGDLPSAILASSAFPSLMDPVKIGDSIYIDGAITVNYPSEHLKKKGMDIVIGVDLSQELSTREELNSVVDILNQVIDFQIQRETQRQYGFTDINIKPDLKNKTSADFGEKKLLLTQGYREGLKYAEILDKLPKRGNNLNKIIVPDRDARYPIQDVVMEGNNIFGRNYVLGKMNLKLPEQLSYPQINEKIDKLYTTGNYEFINYDLEKRGSESTLHLELQEDDTRLFLKFGLHYDDVFKTGLLINATGKRVLFRNAILSADLIIGDQPRYYFNYFIDNGYLPGFGVSSTGFKLQLKNSQNDIKEKWGWVRNNAFLQSTFLDRYAIGGGLSHDYYEINSAPGWQGKKSHNYFNPYFFIKSDTRDQKDFPTRGLYLDAGARYLDIFSNSSDEVLQTTLDLRAFFPLSRVFTYSLDTFAGISLGKEAPHFYLFRPGAVIGQPLGTFTSFTGYRFGDLATDNLFSFKNSLQVEFARNFFATGHYSLANLFAGSDMKKVLRISHHSVGISGGYRSPFGQIRVDFSQPLNSGYNGVFSVIMGHWF